MMPEQSNSRLLVVQLNCSNAQAHPRGVKTRENRHLDVLKHVKALRPGKSGFVGDFWQYLSF